MSINYLSLPPESFISMLLFVDGAADWVQAVSSAFSALFSFVLLAGLYFTYRQVRDTNNWNRINNAFNFFTISGLAEQEKLLFDELMKIEIDLTSKSTPLSEDEMEKLWADAETFKATQDYLNLLENFAFGIRAGSLDEDCGYEINGPRLERISLVLAPFINRYQTSNGARYYKDLVMLNNKWISKRSKMIN